MHKEHSGGWKSEVEVTELGQEEKQRVTDPNAIEERGGAGRSKDGERRTDRERTSDAGCPRGSEGVPQDKGRTAVRGRDGGRRTRGPGSGVAEARRMPGNQGLPENEGGGHGQVDGRPGRRRRG